MNKWPIVKLGEVVRHRKEFITINDLSNYKRPRVRTHAQGIVLRDEILGAIIKTKTQQVCRTGEFLVAEIDAKVGGFGIVPEALNNSIVSSHYFLFVIDEAKLDRHFLDYFIRTPMFFEQVAAQGSTNYAAIRPAHVLGYKIPLPPLSEQRRIVARIEELAAQINEAKELRRKTTEEIDALNESGMLNYLKQMNNNYSMRLLGDVVTIRGGGTPAKSNPFYWNGKIPWITPKDMKIRAITDSNDHISELASQESSAKLLQSGAVLVVVRGMILAHTFPSAVLCSTATINQDMKALIPKNEILSDFLCSIFWAMNTQIVMLVEKSTHDTRKLETDKLLNIWIPVPPLKEQHHIVKELNALQAEIDALKSLQTETAAELDALLPTVLDRAFKGNL